MKKEMNLEQALKIIEQKKFDPLDELETDEGFFLLSDWKIIIKKLDVFLQEGFFLRREKEYFIEEYSDIVSVLITRDLKKYFISNINFISLLKDVFKKEDHELLKMKCILETG